MFMNGRGVKKHELEFSQNTEGTKAACRDPSNDGEAHFTKKDLHSTKITFWVRELFVTNCLSSFSSEIAEAMIKMAVPTAVQCSVVNYPADSCFSGCILWKGVLASEWICQMCQHKIESEYLELHKSQLCLTAPEEPFVLSDCWINIWKKRKSLIELMLWGHLQMQQIPQALNAVRYFF